MQEAYFSIHTNCLYNSCFILDHIHAMVWAWSIVTCGRFNSFLFGVHSSTLTFYLNYFKHEKTNILDAIIFINSSLINFFKKKEADIIVVVCQRFFAPSTCKKEKTVLSICYFIVPIILSSLSKFEKMHSKTTVIFFPIFL